MGATKLRDVDNKEVVKTLLDVWKETRSLTYDLIKDTLTDAKLNEKVDRPGLNTLAKQIYELALVQNAYSDVIGGKQLDFSNVEDMTVGNKEYFAKNKQELVNILKNADSHFTKIIQNMDDWNKKITLFEEKVPYYMILELMIRHETFHHGQLVLFYYLLNIKFPSSWVDSWALPQKY